MPSFSFQKMECQVDKKVHFRHLLLFTFNQGLNASKAAQTICAVYGKDAIGESTARKWFARFNEGNFELSDCTRSGRPSLFDEDLLNDLLLQDPRQTTRELAKKMDCFWSTVGRKS
jgi:transposase